MPAAGGVQGRGRIECQIVTGDGPAIIILNDRQPGSGRYLPLTHQENIEQTVIRLPDRIGSLGFSTMEQIKSLCICFLAFLSQGDEG